MLFCPKELLRRSFPLWSLLQTRCGADLALTGLTLVLLRTALSPQWKVSRFLSRALYWEQN